MGIAARLLFPGIAVEMQTQIFSIRHDWSVSDQTQMDNTAWLRSVKNRLHENKKNKILLEWTSMN
jgi:hypothetical protein